VWTALVQIVLEGSRLPGSTCGPYQQVHVGLQVGKEPQGLVSGDAAEARWATEVRVVDAPGGADFRGPAVHGRPADRFLYLTWGELIDGRFTMFRRAKLMLAELRPLVASEVVVGRLELTDSCGLPVCAQMRPPALQWTAGDAAQVPQKVR
jgi:hypothetical protein